MSIFLFYEKIFNIAKNFKEAEEWDIHQVINMSVDERIKAAKELEIFSMEKMSQMQGKANSSNAKK